MGNQDSELPLPVERKEVINEPQVTHQRSLHRPQPRQPNREEERRHFLILLRGIPGETREPFNVNG